MKSLPRFALIYFAIAAGSFVLAAGCKPDQKPKAQNQQSGAEREAIAIHTQEIKLITAAAIFYRQQTAAANLAQTKSSNAAVRAFAKTIGERYGAKKEELDATAADLKISVPGELADDSEEYNSLNNEDATGFDDQYIKSVIEDHTDAIEMYTAEMKATADQETRKWVAIELALLRENLDGALTVQTQITKTTNQ